MCAETPGDHPDGVCVDVEGALRYADVGNKHCVRVREGGEVLDAVTCDRGCFACMLGGAGGNGLFIVAQQWGAALRVRRRAREPASPKRKGGTFMSSRACGTLA